MKKISFAFFLLIFITVAGFSQVPGAFNYQAVVRNTSGEIIRDQNVSFRISILRNSENGAAVYAETHQAQTNEFGLVKLKIGNGSVVSGAFNPGAWGSNSHFIKVEMDAGGGNSYTNLGTSQLLAVPYAFHAKTVENDEVDDADADPENELQTLSVSGNELSISEGNTVTLPTGNTGLWSKEGDNIYYQSGNVMIGTTSPNNNAPLTVNGRDKNSWISLTNDATGNTLHDGFQIGPVYNNSAVYFWNLENSPLIFATNNQERLRISKEGHVGIGTDPSGGARTFQVIKDDELTIAAENNTTSLPTMHLNNKSGGVAAWIVGKIVLKDGTEGLGKVLTSDDTGYASWQAPLWTKKGTSAYYTNGNIGIGTQSPLAGLHLKGTGYPSSFMFLEAATDQDAGFRLYEGSTAKWHIFNNAAAGGLQIYNSAAATAIFAKQSNSYVGIRTTSPAYALHVNGDAAKTTGSTAWIISSDRRLKDIHGNYEKGLAEIIALQPIRYSYKKHNHRQLPSDIEQVGFVAQEVQKLFPEAVSEWEDGYLDFNIHSINVAMVNAIIELKTENENLTSKVKDLESRLEQLESVFNASASINQK